MRKASLLSFSIFLLLMILPYSAASNQSQNSSQIGQLNSSINSLGLNVTNSSVYIPKEIPVNVFPMGSNFTILRYMVPRCRVVPISSISSVPIFTTVKIGPRQYAEITGPILFGCEGIKGNMSVRILGKETRNVTLYVNGTLTNYTVTVINVTVMLKPPKYEPYGLKTRNMSIVYSRYNSTYELVTVRLPHLYFWRSLDDFAPSTVFNVSSPRDLGWPENITIRILINRQNGDAYLLDDGKKEYLGKSPFWLPIFKPQHYAESILSNTLELIREIKANPWAVEEVIDRARNSNMTVSGALLDSLALNMTDEILHPRYTYLGHTMVIRLGSSSPVVWVLASGNYLVYTYEAGMLPKRKLRIDGRVWNWSDALKEAVIDYLRNGNGSMIVKYIEAGFEWDWGYSPVYQDYADVYHRLLLVDMGVPITRDMTLTLPLPEKYRRMMNASYILIAPVPAPHHPLHVVYDPSLFTPKNLTREWSFLSERVSALENDLINRILAILNNVSASKEFSPDIFEQLYPFLVNELEECGFNVTALNSTITTRTSTSKTRIMSSTTSSVPTSSQSKINSSTTRNKRSICGPASLLALTLTPLLTKRRKKK